MGVAQMAVTHPFTFLPCQLLPAHRLFAESPTLISAPRCLAVPVEITLN